MRLQLGDGTIIYDWVILGPNGMVVGSYSEKHRAIEYASALTYHRKLQCKIISQEDYLQLKGGIL